MGSVGFVGIGLVGFSGSEGLGSERSLQDLKVL